MKRLVSAERYWLFRSLESVRFACALFYCERGRVGIALRYYKLEQDSKYQEQHGARRIAPMALPKGIMITFRGGSASEVGLPSARIPIHRPNTFRKGKRPKFNHPGAASSNRGLGFKRIGYVFS